MRYDEWIRKRRQLYLFLLASNIDINTSPLLRYARNDGIMKYEEKNYSIQ